MVQALTPARSWTRIALAVFAITGLVLALLVVVRPVAAGGSATLNPAHVGTNSADVEDDPEECADADVPDGQVLWHFILNGIDPGIDSAIAGHFDFANDDNDQDVDSSKWNPGGSTHHFYVFTDGDDTLEGATADIGGSAYNNFNLSHICHGGPEGGSQPDTAVSLPGGGNPIPTILFGSILIGSLGALAYANVAAARRRS